MLTVFILLLLLSLVMIAAAIAGKLPLWAAVLVMWIILALERIPLGR
jgi:hypothetical protein